jgi:hypothetical protein
MATLTTDQQSVVNERDELSPKLQRLKNFVQSPAFAALANDEKERQTRQVWVMGLYLNVLNERIAAFS